MWDRMVVEDEFTENYGRYFEAITEFIFYSEYHRKTSEDFVQGNSESVWFFCGDWTVRE